MPYGVSKWPAASDPRSPIFSYYGYAYGAVAPWKFFCISPGALAPFDWLSDGIIIESIADTPTLTTYHWDDSGSPGRSIDVSKAGQVIPGVTPLDWTVRFSIVIEVLAGNRYEGVLQLTYPDAIRSYDSIAMSATVGPSGLMPNGVTLRPRPYQAHNI